MLRTMSDFEEEVRQYDTRLKKEDSLTIRKLILKGVHYLTIYCQPFYTQEIIEMSDYYDRDTFVFTPDYNVVDYYEILSTTSDVTWTVRNDGLVDVENNKPDSSSTDTITFKYFYYPDVELDETVPANFNVKEGIDHLMVDAIKVQVYSYLRDFEKMQYWEQDLKTDIALNPDLTPRNMLHDTDGTAFWYKGFV